MCKNEYSCSNVEKKRRKKLQGRSHAWNYPYPSRDLQLKTLMYFLSTYASIRTNGAKKRREEKRKRRNRLEQFLSRLQQSLEWKPRRSPLERSKASWGNVTFSIKHLDITILQESVDVTRTRDKLLSSYATQRTPVSRKVTKSLLPVAEWFITRPRLDLHPRESISTETNLPLVSAVSNTDPRASD